MVAEQQTRLLVAAAGAVHGRAFALLVCLPVELFISALARAVMAPQQTELVEPRVATLGLIKLPTLLQLLLPMVRLQKAARAVRQRGRVALEVWRLPVWEL